MLFKMKSFRLSLRSLYLTVIFSTFFAPTTGAQVPGPPDTSVKPVVTYNKKDSGLPAIVMSFSDGRRAISVLKGPVELSLETPFQVTENLCFPEVVKPRCDLLIHYFSAEISLIWDRHPDSAKIGKIVLVKSSASPEQTNRMYDYFGNIPFQDSNNSDNDFFDQSTLRAGGLKCSSYQWFSGIANPTQVNFKTVLDEFMFDNSETGMNENRVLASYHNAKYEYDLTQKMFISQGKNPRIDFQIPVGETLSFIMERPSQINSAGEICQITASHGRSVLLSRYTANQSKVRGVSALPLLSNKVPQDYLSTIRYISALSEESFL